QEVNLRCLLLSSKEGVPLGEVLRDYRVLASKQLDLQGRGTLLEYLSGLPHVVRLSRDPMSSGGYRCFGVVTESSRAIVELINKQKSNKKRKRNRGAGSAPVSRRPPPQKAKVSQNAPPPPQPAARQSLPIPSQQQQKQPKPLMRPSQKTKLSQNPPPPPRPAAARESLQTLPPYIYTRNPSQQQQQQQQPNLLMPPSPPPQTPGFIETSFINLSALRSGQQFTARYRLLNSDEAAAEDLVAIETIPIVELRRSIESTLDEAGQLLNRLTAEPALHCRVRCQADVILSDEIYLVEADGCLARCSLLDVDYSAELGDIVLMDWPFNSSSSSCQRIQLDQLIRLPPVCRLILHLSRRQANEDLIKQMARELGFIRLRLANLPPACGFVRCQRRSVSRVLTGGCSSDDGWLPARNFRLLTKGSETAGLLPLVELVN
ncbi:hypothetical protein BOX15_Mlig029870g2, partial [Macrostomum lignano]